MRKGAYLLNDARPAVTRTELNGHKEIFLRSLLTDKMRSDRIGTMWLFPLDNTVLTR
jgi:hypothetical protein